MKHSQQVFELLKKKKPGDPLQVSTDKGTQDAFLVRRGRQNVRVKFSLESEETHLVGLDDVLLEKAKGD
jgi:hypothetical protein